MAEQHQQQQDQPKRKSGKGKGADEGVVANRTGGGFAPVAGERQADDRPPEEQPGEQAHLGSDRPYEGEDVQVQTLGDDG